MAMYGLRFASRFARLAGRGLRGVARRLPRAFRMRPRRRVVGKKVVNKVHSFFRWCDKDTMYGSNGPSSILETGSDQHLAYQFKLDNVVNPSDFTNLYDSYKINKIMLYIEPTIDQTVNLAQGLQRKISVVHDYNDANVFSDEDQYLEYANCKRYAPFGKRGIRITLYPKLNNIIENVGGSANAFTSMNSSKVWLNIASDEVPHFGIKIMIPGGLTTVTDPETQIFRVRAKFHLSMKNSK